VNSDDPSASADIRRLERAVHSRPADVALHRQLAEAHHRLLETDGAEAELLAICRDQPQAFTSLLHLAHIIERRGIAHGAIVGYTRAIKTAQGRGFWFDETSTPPWLRDQVLHAMQYAHEGKIAMFHDWLEPKYARFGKAELARVAHCLAMYLGLAPVQLADQRQRPSFLYFPGLPVEPVFSRASLPFADEYEAETEAIAAEARAVLERAEGIQAFHYDVPEDGRAALARDWDAYFFFDEGERLTAHHDACPHTSSVLARLPLGHVRDHGPEVCFSIMRPGARILPHRGVTNTRAVLHLGLEIPEGCALNLTGVLEQHWQRGKCFAFDDTFEHEAWNKSETTRVVLLGDIWNPHLRASEREAVAELVALIGDFNRWTAVTT
jgi:hypothetical protein